MSSRKTAAYSRRPVSKGGERERRAYRPTSAGRLQKPLRSRDGAMTNTKDIRDQILGALDAAEAELASDIVVYNGIVDDEGYGKFVQATKNIKPDRGLVLSLETYGGSADSAYRIARYSQNYFEQFVVFTPSACKSAGTLLAMGAKKIYMSPFGELGPLDVQVFKTDEFMDRRSGLLSKSALWSLTEEAFKTYEQVLLRLKARSGGTISFRTCSEVATLMANGLLGPIAAQLDPLLIGEDYQNLHIAQQYGEKLIEKYGVIDEQAVISLVENYPSHEFVIDIFEASELFGNVEMAPECLVKLQACLTTQTSGLDAVSVYRVRDIFGEADERANDQEDAAPDDGGGDQNEGPDSGSQRQNWGSDQGSGVDGSGSSALKSRGPVRVK